MYRYAPRTQVVLEVVWAGVVVFVIALFFGLAGVSMADESTITAQIQAEQSTNGRITGGTNETDKIQDLYRDIEVQQRQIEAQQRQLEIQMQTLKQLQSEVDQYGKITDNEQTRTYEDSGPAQSPPEPDKSQLKADEKSSRSSLGTVDSNDPLRPRQTGVSQTDRLDAESPTSVDATYFDPAAVINIPGTETSIGLHGFVQFQIIHDTNGPFGNQFDTAFIPVEDVPSETKFNVNPSRLAFSSATPVSDGQVNTLISIDFNGQVDRPDPRLRLAYGEFVNGNLGLGLLGGQTFATMADMRAIPETLDFAVPAGTWAQRQPLLRFTKSLGGNFLLESSIETPQNVRYINAEKRTRLPDLVLAGTWMLGGDYFKHFRLNALARDLQAEGVNGTTDSAFGWSVAASTKLGLPFLGKRDNLKLNVHYGDGYGTQLKGGPEEAIFNTMNSELDLIGIWSLYGGIQHFWTEAFRSNVTFGHVSADNPSSMPVEALESTTYASVNIVWNPFKQITLGVEYLWGRRENINGASGTSNRLLFSSRFDF